MIILFFKRTNSRFSIVAKSHGSTVRLTDLESFSGFLTSYISLKVSHGFQDFSSRKYQNCTIFMEIPIFFVIWSWKETLLWFIVENILSLVTFFICLFYKKSCFLANLEEPNFKTFLACRPQPWWGLLK